MLWKESTTCFFETYFWIKTQQKDFFKKTMRMKTMKDFPKNQMNSYIIA